MLGTQVCKEKQNVKRSYEIALRLSPHELALRADPQEGHVGMDGMLVRITYQTEVSKR